MKERTPFDVIQEAQKEIKGLLADPTSIATKELDIPPRMSGDLAPPGPYEPNILNGQYRCEMCGHYFDPDEGGWIDEHFFCHEHKEEVELLDREERKSKCLP